MKKILLLWAALLAAAGARADEGMWLPGLIADRIGDMRAKGFRLTADDIYSINRASMKDAVVLFNGGCTGEIVSERGLLLTNHHCGYGAIQSHSTTEHDYLTHGFWARSEAEELPNEDLYVCILVRMEEVTGRLAAGERPEQICRDAEAEGTGYRASIEQMYYGTQQFLFVYERFDDVRLVAAPPSSIGKFGGDTDNWIWPRHTGDFSVFRIYADAQNKPAKYAPGNVPYRPKRHFTVSTRGVQEGDFTMIYGFPGNTQEYVLSDAVDYVANRSDPAKIAIRTGRLAIITAAQESDPALRIHYAARHASIANAWKKWQGETLGLNRSRAVERKRRYEADFAAWASQQPACAQLLPAMKAEYARILDPYFAREITVETLGTLPVRYSDQERSAEAFERSRSTEQALFRYACDAYARRCPESWQVNAFRQGVAEAGSTEAYADRLFAGAWDRRDTAARQQLQREVAQQINRIGTLLGARSLRNPTSRTLDSLYGRYLSALRQWDTRRAFYPDANLTLRVAYGQVAGYEYADGEYHTPQTTLDGIIAKDNPEIYDYDIPQALRDRYAAQDYGRWGVEINGRRTVPVCFLATNHTTGGNSGSPVLNGRGELVGINFDRTWRSTMSDMAFDPTICRNIAVDIRYVLFVMERIGGTNWLLDEMTLR